MRIAGLLLLFILPLMTWANIRPEQGYDNDPGPSVSALSIYNQCDQPHDLLPVIQILLNDYYAGTVLNSEFYQKFLWIHPEYHDFAVCAICAGGRPNDSFWESDFQIDCLSGEGTYYTQPQNEDYYTPDLSSESI